MPDIFSMTVVAIVISTLVIAYIRRAVRDKCLKNFEHDIVSLELKNGEIYKGILDLESTGLEIIYHPVMEDKKSWILYRHEYSQIKMLIRNHSDLDEKNRKKREKELLHTYQPNIFRRWGRSLQNIIKTIRDSFIDIISILLGQMQSKNMATQLITSNQNQTKQVSQELVKMIDTSFEPLLEKHIGKKILVEISETKQKISGILKDYSSEFLEILDVDYLCSEKLNHECADMVIPRSVAIVRHAKNE